MIRGNVVEMLANDPKELDGLIAYIQTLGRQKDWRPAQDYEQ